MRPMEIGLITPAEPDPGQTLSKLEMVGLKCIQLGCPPRISLTDSYRREMAEALRKEEIEVTTLFCSYEGESYKDIQAVRDTVGLVPPERRKDRIDRTKQISDFAKDIGTDQIGAHIGFIPPADDPRYSDILQTMTEISDYCASNGQEFCLETGQETAEELLEFIRRLSRDNVKVNFDPANMIMYGSGDPIQSLLLLAQYVVGVHCKDGRWPKEKGRLGEETPLGHGDVGIKDFVETLKRIAYKGPLIIEREISGEQQIKDIKEAVKLLEKLR